MIIDAKRIYAQYEDVVNFIILKLPHLFIGSDMDMVKETLTISVKSEGFLLVYRGSDIESFISKELPFGNYSWLVFEPTCC